MTLGEKIILALLIVEVALGVAAFWRGGTKTNRRPGRHVPPRPLPPRAKSIPFAVWRRP